MLALSAAMLLATSAVAYPVGDSPNEAAGDSSPQYLRMTAQKLRGSTFGNAEVGAEPFFLEKRDDGDSGYVSIELQNENTFYLTEIEVGNPAQKIGVLVDTGSSDLWVVATNNSYCQSNTGGPLGSKARSADDIYDFNNVTPLADGDAAAGDGDGDGNFKASEVQTQQKASSSGTAINCSTYGTFDPADSETFHSNGTAFSITYADSTFAKGVWGYDDVVINGANVTDLSLAVCDNADNAMGILGIGLSGLETTFSGSVSASSSSSDPYQYENLPLRLKSQGLIKQVAYSVYLNDSSADSANILFGAVDHNRYTGDMIALPIINTMKSKGYNDALQLDITLNSLILVDRSSSQQAVIGTGAASALLDTGTTLTYVPQNVLSAVIGLLNAQYSSSVGQYVIKCADADNLYLVFNFQGQEINIEMSSFLVSLVTSRGSSSDYCMVGLQSSGASSFTLGDSFLRNVYMVADLDNMEIGLATANHDNSDSEDIEVLSTGIPSAMTPASSLTWGAQSTSLFVQSGVQMSSIPASQSSYQFQSKKSTTTATTKRDSNMTTGAAVTSTSSSTVSSISSGNSKNAANGNNSMLNAVYSFTGSLLLLIAALV